LATVFGSGTLTSVGVPHALQAEADLAVAALADHVGGSFAELDGVARGNVQLAPGTGISLSLAGDPFDGQYVLTTTRHRFDPNDGYTTAFTVSGKNHRSLLGLTAGGSTGSGGSTGATGGGSSSQITGVATAIVTDVGDPENMGRIKVSYPWLDESYSSDWAPMTQAGAGANRGAVFLPEVGDEVVVGFDHGDQGHPIVLGSLYNGVDKPNLGDGLVDGTSGAVKRRGIVSKDGHMLVFFDDASDEGVALLSGDKSLKVSLNQTGTTIKISSTGSVTIDGTNGVTITSSSDISVEATGTLSLKGAEVQISADADVSLSGTPIKLN
jgi:phage baseplate assembly protein gpV